jgi:hypothetical protein
MLSDNHSNRRPFSLAKSQRKELYFSHCTQDISGSPNTFPAENNRFKANN